jgi:glycine/D-amino acid oxidase-like deaminating enzyme
LFHAAPLLKFSASTSEPRRLTSILGSGATGRNGGHFTPVIFDDFVERSSYPIPDPVDDAIRVSRLEQYTSNTMASLIAEQGWGEDIDFVQNGHTRLFLSDADEEAARRNYEAAKKAGVPVDDVRWISKDEMKQKNGAHNPGVWFPASTVWPIKLVTRMFLLAQNIATSSSSATSSVSIRLFTHTVVTSVTAPDDAPVTQARWTVKTSRGRIRTRYVIHATNAYASHLLPQFAPPPPTSAVPSSITRNLPSDSAAPQLYSPVSKKPSAAWIAPTRGQVIGTRATVSPNKLWKSSGLANWGTELWHPRYWHPRPPLKNPQRENGEKALVIIGGARDSARGALDMGVIDDSEVNPHVSKALCQFLPRTFPGLFEEGVEPEYEWVSYVMSTSENC